MSDREVFEAKIETAEARTDTKFAQLIGKIDVSVSELKADLKTSVSDLRGALGVIATRLDHVERSTAGTKTTIIVTAIAVVGVIVAILAYGQQYFGLGLSTRDIVRATVTELHQQEVTQPKK